MHLFSDPTYAGLECAPFALAPRRPATPVSVFDNGLPLARTDWIRDGKLTSLIQTRHTAAMTGQPVTPYVDNLVLEVDGGTGSIDDLVAGRERGLLLTCLWYIREVDPQTLLLTGLTRDGVYLVENGEITGAVNNFRFNESPVDLLAPLHARLRDRAELQPRVGRRLLLAHRDAGAAGARLQHVERLAGAVMEQPRDFVVPDSPAARRRVSRATVRVLVLDHDGRILLFQDSAPAPVPPGGSRPAAASTRARRSTRPSCASWRRRPDCSSPRAT